MKKRAQTTVQIGPSDHGHFIPMIPLSTEITRRSSEKALGTGAVDSQPSRVKSPSIEQASFYSVTHKDVKNH